MQAGAVLPCEPKRGLASGDYSARVLSVCRSRRQPQRENKWLIDFCHRRSTECIKMAESCADADTERRKVWLDHAKQWSRLPEETVLRKAGAAAVVQAIMRSRQ